MFKCYNAVLSRLCTLCILQSLCKSQKFVKKERLVLVTLRAPICTFLALKFFVPHLNH